MRHSLGLALVLAASCTLTVGAQDLFELSLKEGEQLKAPALNLDDEFYLSPELAVSEATNAKVVGMNSLGKMVYALDNTQRSNVMELEVVVGVQKAKEGLDELKPAQLIIGFKKGADTKAIEKSLTNAGFKIVPRRNGDRFSKRGRFFVVVAKNGEQANAITGSMIKSLRAQVRLSGANSATPNYQVSFPKPKRRAAIRATPAGAADGCQNLPQDARFDELWGMRNIRGPRAWNVVTKSPVVVAVIDSGVDYTHPDLAGNMWRNEAELSGTAGVDDDGNGYVDDIHGFDFANFDGDPQDDNDHGTHVAGTIGAVADLSGVVGVNWDVKIMAIKFLSASGSGSLADAIDAIYYGIDNGARIENNSWSGGGFNPSMLEAIEEANDKGVLFVAAAGNETNDNDQNPSYPASYAVENVISIASIDEDEKISSFSNFGKTTVDMAAPGGAILSTIPDGGFDVFSGTSMATPHVSGALALLYGHPDFAGSSHIDAKTRILSESRKLDALSGRCVSEGTLDIEFLGGDCACEQASTQIVSSSIRAGSVTLSSTQTTLSVLKLTLNSPASVVITGNTSARSNTDSVLDFSLSSSEGDWSDAVRYVSLTSESWTSITLHQGVQLPAGSHEITWSGSVLDDGAKIDIDGGSLTAIATPLAPTTPNRRVAVTRATENASHPVRIRFDRGPNLDGGVFGVPSENPSQRVRSTRHWPTSSFGRTMGSGDSQLRASIVRALLNIAEDSDNDQEVRLEAIQAILRL